MIKKFSDIDHDKLYKHTGNRFDLVLLAAQKARKIKKNQTEHNKTNILLLALEEIQNGKLT